MPTPKSVISIKKGEGGSYVEYEKNFDAAEYYIFELSRAALRDVAKYVKRVFKEQYYSVFKKHTGNAGKATSSKVYSGKNTKYPRLEIGLKTGKVDGFYAYFQEFGTSKTPRLGMLTHAVQDNIAEIVKIESQYLSGLEGEAEALEALIDEDEYDDDDE